MKIERTRYIPHHTEERATEDYVCYIDKDKLIAICYVGKATKSTFYYRYRTLEQLEESVSENLRRITEFCDRKREEKAKQAEANKNFDIRNYLKVGDIIQNSWGYDQTNQEFYQLLRFRGTKQIVVREIAQKTVHKDGYSSMSCFVLPEKDNFLTDEKEFTLTCKAYLSEPFFHICNPKDFYYFHLWSGKEAYCSWYA